MPDANPTHAASDTWDSGASYELYVGRWSRPVAREFIQWLAVPPGSQWLDIGSGTGVVSETVLSLADPGNVQGVDRSDTFVAHARDHVTDERIHFKVGDAQQLPFKRHWFDAVVSGLVLNFIPDMNTAIREMARVVKPGGVVAAYVWDYAGEMQMMRYFWDAAITLHPDALSRDEGHRFPICKPEPLATLLEQNGLKQVEVRSIDILTHFRDFDDYWTPFLSGLAPAPGYTMSLSEEERAELRQHIRRKLPYNGDGSIDMTARAWAVRGIVP